MTIQTVALSQLAISPLNVRKVKPSQIETLAEDIAAHGLIQSLGVYEEEGTFHVFAGGRRLRALQHLAKAGTIEATHAVPVMVRSKAEAVELSAAENLQRETMHPADQIRAFGAMHSDGHTQGEIAARFGYPQSHVARLLKLASLSPSLIQAIAKDELSLEAARVLTLTDDQKVQREAFAQCGDSAHALRRYLSEDKMKTSDRLFRLVGREAYEAEGGTITVDLFSEGDEGYADDRGLVEVLASRKLDEVAQGLKGEGWHTVRPCLEMPEDYYSLRSLYPEERDLTPEEDADLAKLEEQLARAEEDQNEDEWERLDNEREAILDSARTFTEDQRQIGGVIVTVDYEGRLSLKHYYAIKPKAEREGEGDTAPALYSAKLVADMAALRTMALQNAVEADGTLALDIVLDTLASRLLHHRYWDGAGTIEARSAMVSAPEDLHDERLGGVEERIAERFADLPKTERFETIAAMDMSEKMDLLAGLVAMTITEAAPQHPYTLAAGIDMAEHWQVTVPFCDRLTKSQALAIMEAECGAEAVASCSKLKKGDLSIQLAERLPAGWLPEPMQSQAQRGVSPSSQDQDDQASEVA